MIRRMFVVILLIQIVFQSAIADEKPEDRKSMTKTLSLLAGGRIRDAATNRPAGDPVRTRLVKVDDALGAHLPPTAAIAAVYGHNWSQHPYRDEIIALLVGTDTIARGRLAAISHADLSLSVADNYRAVLNLEFREALKTAFPYGGLDSVRRPVWKITFTMKRISNSEVVPTESSSFPFSYEAITFTSENRQFASVRGTKTIFTVSEENAYLLLSREVSQSVVRDLIDRVLADEEQSVPSRAAAIPL